MSRVVVDPAVAGGMIGLELVELAPGERFELPPRGGPARARETAPAAERETVVVVFGGTVEVEADGRSLGMAGGRADVFEGPGFAIYAPPATVLRLTATTKASLAVATAPLDGREAPVGARIIAPADQRIAEVGKANWTRHIRTILGPEHAAGRLLLGETINPPGNWSSYPPHKHDRQAPPEEVQLEEVYFYKVDPAGGFGVQLLYGEAGQRATIVRDGDSVMIPGGYHPVVAAPGYSLYYLWIMAGQGRAMTPYVEPAHRWIQEA